MSVYNKALIELENALKAIEAMEASKDLHSYERAWIDFVTYIDRTYNKIRAATPPDGKAHKILAKINQDRKNDDLLKYIMQARNSSEHSIDSITEKQAGGLSIGSGHKSNSGYIHSLIYKNGVVEQSPLNYNVIVEFSEEGLRLAQIRNRGVIYDAPTFHMGCKIAKASISKVARLAYDYYSKHLAMLIRSTVA